MSYGRRGPGGRLALNQRRQRRARTGCLPPEDHMWFEWSFFILNNKQINEVLTFEPWWPRCVWARCRSSRSPRRRLRPARGWSCGVLGSSPGSSGSSLAVCPEDVSVGRWLKTNLCGGRSVADKRQISFAPPEGALHQRAWPNSHADHLISKLYKVPDLSFNLSDKLQVFPAIRGEKTDNQSTFTCTMSNEDKRRSQRQTWHPPSDCHCTLKSLGHWKGRTRSWSAAPRPNACSSPAWHTPGHTQA